MNYENFQGNPLLSRYHELSSISASVTFQTLTYVIYLPAFSLTDCNVIFLVNH